MIHSWAQFRSHRRIMTPDAPDGTTSPRPEPIDGLPAESAATPETCTRCNQPLTRRGASGECLRCLANFVLLPDDEPAANDPIERSELKSAKRRYGHFEINVGADGHPTELGAGAMAVTYRAQDIVLHSSVALKVINKSVAEHPEARARFLREARAAAKLHHPNVASVSHYGEQDGECYYVMELVEGETLEARVRREGMLSVALVLEIGIQVARALAAAEACGVVHRDLKPSNIMLTERQGEIGGSDSLTVKVIDWGLAKAISAAAGAEADHTRNGFVGTPAFASPEQFARAETSRVDTRTDIYSLGVTLWYLLCGKTPFAGRTLEEIHAQQVNEPLPLAQLSAAGIPAEVIALVESMLAVNPVARPQSARELLEALRKCRESLAPAKPHLPGKNKFRELALTLGLVTFLCVGAGAWWYRTRPPPTPEDRSIAVLPFENLSPEKADAFFTVGVQDEINADLARISALKVVSADSSRPSPTNDLDPTKIGAELGVRHLLGGSVRRESGQVHIAIRLVDVRDLNHPWMEQYDRKLSDVFAVQGEITRAIAARLDARLSPGEKAAINEPPTSDLAAYDLYLRAREGPRLYQTPDEHRRYAEGEIPLLESAVARDPGFALAYCELANAHEILYQDSLGKANPPAVDHRNLAEVALANARRLRPDAGELHLEQADHFCGVIHDYEQARLEINLARKSLPNSAEVEEIGAMIARAESKWEEAIQCLEKAAALEPRNARARFALANTCRLMRRYDEFDHLMDQLISTMTVKDSVAYRPFRALGRLEARADLAPLRAAITAVSPADPNGETTDLYALILALCAHEPDAVSKILAATTKTHFQISGVNYPKAWFEALAARMRGDRSGTQAAFTDARLDVDRAVAANPTNGRTLSLLAMIDAGLGNKDDAVREGRRACELVPLEKSATSAPIVATDLAVVYAWTDQPDLACGLLEEWINRPAGSNLPAQPTYGDLRLNPLWDPLKGNPRFVALVTRLDPTPGH